MTTLSLLPPFLRRLFASIDAAGARGRALHLALEYWRGRRGDRLMPAEGDLHLGELGKAQDRLFIFRRAGDDWNLVSAGAAIHGLLAPPVQAQGLSELGNRRMAARLRRLFELVAETAEPVAAEFETGRHGEDVHTVEILVAPLAADGRTVDGMFGGIVEHDGRKRRA